MGDGNAQIFCSLVRRAYGHEYPSSKHWLSFVDDFREDIKKSSDRFINELQPPVVLLLMYVVEAVFTLASSSIIALRSKLRL